MSRTRTTLIVAAAVAGVLVVSGCAPKLPAPTTPASTTQPASSQASTQQASVEPTTPANIVASGPIETPRVGSERTALLDAARKTLGITSSFYVYQLYVQGDTAIGDVEPTAKSAVGRLFVAWERRGGTWTAIGASKFGSSSANAASTARALPSFSTELLAKIDWTLPKPKPTPTKGTLTSSATLKSLSAAAQKWSNTAMSGKGVPYKLTVLKVAQDSAGVWWGRVVSQPSTDKNGSYEALQFWAEYTGGSWQGKVQDPEPPAPTTYFPASVVSKLGL